MSPFDHSTGIQLLLDGLRASGDVRAALLARAFDRLRLLARRMFRRFRDLRAAVETDDVLQGAAARLHRSLPEVLPGSVLQFFGLAARQTRRELLDLVRRFRTAGEAGVERVAYLSAPASTAHHPALARQEDPEGEPSTLEEWSDFHRAVEGLPDEEREAFDLLWYQGLTQPEAAALLDVSPRTVKRRWRSARLLLHQRLHGDWPGSATAGGPP
jgi:RNA polymerase sigma-70 factor (ECF subfamily)